MTKPVTHLHRFQNRHPKHHGERGVCRVVTMRFIPAADVDSYDFKNKFNY